ncbi:uncharacterized protein LOC141682723 [Apium graveolens]|uniref:uncharacterized protein LOC141682723 n=1 Tax=Apium graveolens TaxID=4045 RepID=UPI003D7BCE35
MYDGLELANVVAAGAAALAAAVEAELAEVVSIVAIKVAREKMESAAMAPWDLAVILEADWVIDAAKAAMEASVMRQEEACVAALVAAEAAEAAAIATEAEMRRLSGEK